MKKLLKNLCALSLISIAITSCDTPTLDSSSTNEIPSSEESSSVFEDISSEESSSVFEDSSSEDENVYQTISIEEAIALATQAGEAGTTEKYYITATILNVSNPTFGEMTIEDETGTLFIYGTYSSDGVKRYSELEDKPVKGDIVTLYGSLNTYNGTPQIKSGWIMDFTHVAPEVDENAYSEVSVDAARKAAEGNKVKVDGVVASITYANGFIPNGFHLVDETGSIYVYGVDAAGQVSVGNTITVAAEKTYYVLEKEKDFANKYGYIGACQLQEPIILDNDKTTSDFDTSWVSETTIKKILDTPFDQDITNTIYKVDAFINKREGTGFTNYYFNDLDGTTGSYVYTQCNGNDFDYLDEYDGKLCTLYLTAMNAKSTNSGCVYRFMPISIVSDSTTFDLSKGADFALDYYVSDLFESQYRSNPAIVVPTTANNELIDLENVSITYSSNNESLVYFETVEEQLVMNTNNENSGSATITATATYQGYEAIRTYEIEVLATPKVESITVKEAIDSELNETVTVKGIAGPSIVNKTGFYLIDETGVIAVECSGDVMSTIEFGNEVVISGTRSSKGTSGIAGQSLIANGTVVINFYGNYSYSTATFDYSKTLSEISAYSVADDYTTQVYVVDAKIKVVSSAHYMNIYVKDAYNESVELLLYCSSANQYAWLQDYDGQIVTLEVALCNWNQKTPYKGCVLSATDSEGNKTYNTLNYN